MLAEAEHVEIPDKLDDRGCNGAPDYRFAGTLIFYLTGSFVSYIIVDRYFGVVPVSTGTLKMEKLSAGDASNRKPKYKRRRKLRVSSLVAARQP